VKLQTKSKTGNNAIKLELSMTKLTSRFSLQITQTLHLARQTLSFKRRTARLLCTTARPPCTDATTRGPRKLMGTMWPYQPPGLEAHPTSDLQWE